MISRRLYGFKNAIVSGVLIPWTSRFQEFIRLSPHKNTKYILRVGISKTSLPHKPEINQLEVDEIPF